MRLRKIIGYGLVFMGLSIMSVEGYRLYKINELEKAYEQNTQELIQQQKELQEMKELKRQMEEDFYPRGDENYPTIRIV